jgi:hypothetical protein
MEKKKIIARKVATAEEQEKALQALLNVEKQTPRDSEEQEVRTKVVKQAKPKPEPKPTRQPQTVRRKVREILKPPVEVQRITIDLPADLYDLLKKETEEKGTTLRWQIVHLLKNHFKNR